MFLFAAADDTGILALAGVVGIALILVAATLGIAAIVAGILRIKIFFAYWVTNRQRSSGGYTGFSAARKLLDDRGYNDIEVRQSGFFSALVYGNHYNPKRRIVYLRKSTYRGSNLTAVGLALQKAGVAVMDMRGGDEVKKRWKLQKFALFGPIMFIPIVLAGVIADVVFMVLSSGEFQGIGTLICAVLGIAYFIVALVFSSMQIKIEKQANAETLEMLKSSDFLSPEEQEKVGKVFKTYILSYIADFVISILELVKFILQIVFSVLKAMLNRKK